MSSHADRARLLALAAVTAILLAACGGAAASSGPGIAGATQGAGTQTPGSGATTSQPGGGTTVDACALLTADDIKAVTGYTVSRATAGPHGGIFPAGCEWELTAPNEMVPPSIVLGIMTAGGKSYYEKYFKPFNDEQGNTPLAGIGDEAVDGGFSTVMAVKGDNLFNLQYLGEKDLQVELAKKLVAHL